jgi:wyosine [tRNA(Phe)-imidazoG37] synthetase (radical SAM superfamily)
MLVKGVNDDESHLHELARLVRQIRPDRVQLNTPVRPPANTDVRALDRDELEAARDVFGPDAEIIADVAPETRHVAATAEHEPVILALAARRPVTAEEVSAAAGIHLAETLKFLAALEHAGKLRRTVHGGKTFYTSSGEEGGLP